MNNSAFALLLVVAITAVRAVCSDQVITARVLLADKATVVGLLNLTSHADGPVQIRGQISGLSPGAHGFHVHQFGDIFSKGCDSTGPHFNPDQLPHGAPEDKTRHVGDLGNVLADSRGIVEIDVVDAKISLSGPNSIAGRAFVVHTGTDDLGRGGNEGSSKTGNAGGRFACGIVFLTAA